MLVSAYTHYPCITAPEVRLNSRTFGKYTVSLVLCESISIFFLLSLEGTTTEQRETLPAGFLLPHSEDKEE